MTLYREGVPKPTKLIDHIAGADLRSSTWVNFFNTTPRYIQCKDSEQRLSTLFFHHLLYPSGGARAPYQPIVVRAGRAIQRRIYPTGSSATGSAPDPLQALRDIPENAWSSQEPARQTFFYSQQESPVQHPRSSMMWTSKSSSSTSKRKPALLSSSHAEPSSSLLLVDSGLKPLVQAIEECFQGITSSQREELIQQLQPNRHGGLLCFASRREGDQRVPYEVAGLLADATEEDVNAKETLSRMVDQWKQQLVERGIPKASHYLQLRLPEAVVVKARTSSTGEVCRLAGGAEPCVPFAVGFPCQKKPTSDTPLSHTVLAHVNALARVQLAVSEEGSQDNGCPSELAANPRCSPSGAVVQRIKANEPLLGRPIDPLTPFIHRVAVERSPRVSSEDRDIAIGRDDCETYFVPYRSLLITLRVPAQAEEMCNAQNLQRMKKQEKLGHASSTVFATQGRQTAEKKMLHRFHVNHSLTSSSAMRSGTHHLTYQVRVAPGDVVFVPRGWGMTVRRVKGSVMAKSASPKQVGPTIPGALAHRACNESATDQTGKVMTSKAGDSVPEVSNVHVDGFFLLYKPYPVLTQQQADVYVSANYVHGGVTQFYAKGGNDVYRLYE